MVHILRVLTFPHKLTTAFSIITHRIAVIIVSVEFPAVIVVSKIIVVSKTLTISLRASKIRTIHGATTHVIKFLLIREIATVPAVVAAIVPVVVRSVAVTGGAVGIVLIVVIVISGLIRGSFESWGVLLTTEVF